MKKIYLLAFFLIIAVSDSFTQSGKWGLALKASLYNDQSYTSGDGSNIQIWKFLNGSNTKLDSNRFFNANLNGVGGKRWRYEYTPIQYQNNTDRITKLVIHTKLGWDNHSNKDGEDIPQTFQSMSSKIKYEHIHYCDMDACKPYSYTRLYRMWWGYLDAYIFPKDIIIALKSENNFVSAEKKVRIEAPSGYDPSVYVWMYKKDITDAGEEWKPLSNTSLKGSQFIEVSLIDIYGSDYMNLVDFSSNTSVALKYDIYENSTNVKVTEYSSVVTLANKLDAPKIISAEGKIDGCPGDANNGKIVVKVDRSRLPGEIVEFSVFADEKADWNEIDPTTYEIVNLSSGTYTVKIQSLINGNALTTNAEEHTRDVSIVEPDPITYKIDENDIKHVDCNGGSNGSFKVIAGGSSSPYVLWWKSDSDAEFTSDGTNSLEATGLVAGTYQYYVKDSNGCVLRDPDSYTNEPLIKSVEITEPDPIEVTLIPEKTSQPSANGLSNGYMTVKIAGGTPGYTIKWVNKETGTTLSTVENTSGNGQVESKLHDIPGGIYVVTVIDSKGCELSLPAEFVLDEPGVLRVSINQRDYISCHGDNSASLYAIVSGGVPHTSGQEYTYKWYRFVSGSYSQMSTDQSISGLGSGQYKVVVSDAALPPNENEAEYTVEEPGLLEASVGNVDVSCKNTNTGSINISISGGVAPYYIYYRKSGDSNYSEQSTSSLYFSISNIGTGNYEYYIKDNNGCSAKIGTGYSGNSFISEPAEELLAEIFEVKHPTGAGRTDGYVKIKIKGGVPYSGSNKYSVVWRRGGSVVSSSGSLDGSGVYISQADNLGMGTYTITIQDNNANPCVITEILTLQEPRALQVNLNVTKQISCFGVQNAEITARASGGIPNVSGLLYAYKWYKIEEGTPVLIENQNDSILRNRGVGHYKVVIEDHSDPVNTKESAVLEVISPSVLEGSVGLTRGVKCFGETDGLIQVSVSGGTSPYKLFYKHETLDDDYASISISSPNTTFSLNNLSAGKYSVYLEDKNQCSSLIDGESVKEVILDGPEKALSIVSRIVRVPSGDGLSNGYMHLVLDGGTPFDSGDMYQVSWTDENLVPIIPTNGINDQGLFTTEINNLPKGIYFLEVKDRNYQSLYNGCYLSVNLKLEAPLPLTATLRQTETIKCFGDNTGELVAYVEGGIEFESSNGEFYYRYEWYKIENGIDRLVASQTDSILKNVTAGDYKVKIIDGSIPSNEVVSNIITVTEPPRFVIDLKTRMISCFEGSDGFIHISASGGTGTLRFYSKQLGEDPDYREIGLDQATQTFRLDNLAIGTYSVYIQDDNLCYAPIIGPGITEIELTQPVKALGIQSETVYPPSRHDLDNGEITLLLDGGTPESDGSYSVVWKDETGNILSAGNSFTEGYFTSILSDLPAGKFTAMITDANYAGVGPLNNTACILIKEYELIRPEELKVSLEETHYVSCYGMSDGELTAYVQGGVINANAAQSPYKYRWYKQEGEGFVLLQEGGNETFQNIPEGTYKLEVEDYGRIPNVVSAIYQLLQPEALTATTQDKEVDCGETASVSAIALGGTAPYDCRWNTGATGLTINDLYSGKYMAIVTDARGCEATAVAKVVAPIDFSIRETVKDPVCYQSSNGSISIDLIGGTAPFSYQWSTGARTKDIVNLSSGIYNLVVTDSYGCSLSESFELTDPAPKLVDLGEDGTICFGQKFLVEPQVEDPGTSFNWTGPNGFSSGESKVELGQAGTYRLVTTDSNGCQATDEIQIFVTDYQISSEMVVASDVYVNDTILLINISSPEAEKVEWLFSESDPITVVETTPYLAKIIFSQTGNYAVGMRSYEKDCYLDIIKNLTVTESPGIVQDNFGSKEIQEFIVYPNPSNGDFKTKIKLEKKGVARLRLFSTLNGKILSEKTLSGSESYDEQFQKMTLSPGVYVLLLETASGKRSQKLLIR